MKPKFLISFLFLLFSATLFAQKINPQVISSAGNKNFANSVSLEWTLGEPCVTTLQGSNNIITQGFHQPRFAITGISEPLTDMVVKVFPNPTTDIIQINVTSDKNRSMIARLTDVNGKLIWHNEYNGKYISESVSMSDIPDGSYFLNLSINQSKQTFKIQKIK